MLNLNSVTCVFINGDNKNTETYFHLIKNLQNRIKFYKILYFTCGEFLNVKNTTNIPVNSMNYCEFNNFCLRVVPSFVESDYALYIQTDGFPLNPDFWLNEFFNYDYIGAPWPNCWVDLPYRTEGLDGYAYGGNGGFSFRSRRLLQLSSQFDYIYHWNEDWNICYHKLNWLIENGLKISDIEIGKKFSLESDFPNHHNDLNQVFGFHNRYRVDEAHEIFKKNFVLNESF